MEYPSTSSDRSRVKGRLGNMREDIEDNKYGVVCQLLCVACLCSDRNLQPLKHDSLLRYTTIVNGSQLSNTISACWECGARLKKIVRFRQRVVECYDTLVRGDHSCEVSYQPRLQIYKNDDVDIHPQNTSDLQRDAKVESVLLESPINTQARHGTQDIKIVVEIKIEPEEIMVKSEFDTAMRKIKVESQNLFESGAKETGIEAERLHFTAEKIKSEVVEIEIEERNVKVELECMTDSNTATCMACLCVSRKLHYEENTILKQYYRDILEQKQVPDDCVKLGLCFECLSILKTSIRFEDQLRNSHQTLLSSLSTLDTQDMTSLLCSGVSLPPRLRRCVRDRVDIPPHAHTHDPPPPVKLEPGSLGLGDSSPPHPHITSVCEDNPHVCVETATQDPRRRKQGANKPYQCNHCSKAFSFKFLLINHTRRHTKEKPYQCEDCSKAFYEKHFLNVHIKTHNKEKPYQCSHCSRGFITKQSIKQHLKTHSLERPYQCRECSKAFSWKQSLVVHMMTHSAEKPYQCSQCSKVFITKQYLKQHLRAHSAERPYQCHECSRAFSLKHTLVTHMVTHSALKPYQCRQCSKAFARKQDLAYHVSTHSAERPHQCDQCSKSFSLKRSLFCHKKIHTKAYQCSQCSKTFARQVDLTQHIRTHTAERPYQCDQCSKSFSLKRTLVTHRKTHTKEKPNQCSQCLKSFTRKDHLARHMKTHSGERIHGCSQCLKAFTRKDHLAQHMKTHSA